MKPAEYIWVCFPVDNTQEIWWYPTKREAEEHYKRLKNYPKLKLEKPRKLFPGIIAKHHLMCMRDRDGNCLHSLGSGNTVDPRGNCIWCGGHAVRRVK